MYLINVIILFLSLLHAYSCTYDSSSSSNSSSSSINSTDNRLLRFQWAQDNLVEYSGKKPSTGFYANTNTKRGVVIEGTYLYIL